MLGGPKVKVLSMRSMRCWIIVMTISVAGCGNDGAEKVDIRSVDLRVPIGRLDRELFSSDPANIAAASRRAYAEHGEFYRTYVEDILQGVPLHNPELPVMLNAFLQDPDWRSVQHGVDSVLGDLSTEQRQLEDAFKRLQVLFPDSIVPRIITFNSGFNYGIYPTDSVLGIGLEWFIGSDHPVIGMLAPEAFPKYVKDRMRPEMLVPSAVKGWLLVHYARDTRGADVLTNLVEVGKAMALLDVLLPDTDKALKVAFTREQLSWCEENEYRIWRDIVSRDQLFSRQADAVGRLMNDGPYTHGLPQESPGHIGEWIGYRMVRAYLDANPRTTFEQLFAIDDPRVVLKHYKPR